MKSIFYKISANNPEYIKMRDSHAKLINIYKEFLLSIEKYDGKNGKMSTTHKSYPNYLIRMLVFLSNTGQEINQNYNYRDISDKLNQLKAIEGFSDYNKIENGFPNACIQKFSLLVLQDSAKKSTANSKIKKAFSEVVKKPDFGEDHATYLSDIVEDKIRQVRFMRNRNQEFVKQAKVRASWKCELDNQHVTFVSSTGRPYVEGHHLIPLFAQDLFNVDLDFTDNIVALCPLCHARIHNEDFPNRVDIIDRLLLLRSDKFRKLGLIISRKELIDLYLNYTYDDNI